MNEFFAVGDTIHGYCNGFFGRDDYDSKICLLVNDRFALFQYLDGEFEGNGVVLNKSPLLDSETIKKWKEDEN